MTLLGWFYLVTQKYKGDQVKFDSWMNGLFLVNQKYEVTSVV